MVDKSDVNILVLDDEHFMLKLISRMLVKLGYTQTATCDNCLTALELMRSSGTPPDVILLDINMPEMDGVEFLRHLVEQYYYCSILLISGEDERILQSVEKLVQAHHMPVLGRLQKPIQPEALSAMLEKWAPYTANRNTPTSSYTAYQLSSAIAVNELVNYYQPQVDIKTGKVVGVECLARWLNPHTGIVLPRDFITLAENHGLIDDLTRVVIDQAFAQTSEWQKAGLQLRVSINISMDNLSKLAFADYLLAAATRDGVTPENITLEVTESRLMAGAQAPLEILNRLRLKRFNLSIDDFGTGHSSLTQLHNIPFNELKIDREFVHGIANNGTLWTFYNSCLNLAKQLGLTTVAEGVENKADWDLLRKTGCELAQGYFIAPPMPADQIPAWISNWEAGLADILESTDVQGLAKSKQISNEENRLAIGQLNFLVVEDDDFQRKMAVSILRSLGAASIHEAGDGNQALAIISNTKIHKVDIILCDLDMPEMDGLEFLRNLAQAPQGMAVIITSALDSELLHLVETMTQMYGISLLGTIEKPISATRLKELLSGWVD